MGGGRADHLAATSAGLIYRRLNDIGMGSIDDIDELIPLIDHDYATKAEPAGRALAGFSMGGAGSVRLSILHPELFCAAGSWGGALSRRGRGKDSPLLPPQRPTPRR